MASWHDFADRATASDRTVQIVGGMMQTGGGSIGAVASLPTRFAASAARNRHHDSLQHLFSDGNLLSNSAVSTDIEGVISGAVDQKVDTVNTPTTVAARRDDSVQARNRLVITLLLLSAFIMILNETIMGVALSTLMVDLDITPQTAQWLTAGFLLTMAVVIPITGYLLQRFNTRPLFMTAMGLFTVGTIIGSVAPGFEILLIGRIVQASGTAIMFPLLMTTVMTLVPAETRGRMMGNISIVISVAPAVGPTISGLILSVLDWHFMFILMLPIASAALVVGALLMKNITEPRQSRVDISSILLSAAGFGGLVFGLSNLGTAISPFQTVLPLIVGAGCLVSFVFRQLILQRTDRALLDLRTFRSRTFAASIVMFGISMMALFGALVLLPMYLIRVLDTPIITVGLLLLPGGLTMGVLAPFVGRIYDRVGPRALLVTGSTIVCVDLWCLTLLTATSSVWWVVAAQVSLSIGLALLFTPLFTASLGSLPPSLYSHGSAIVGTVQQVAGAAGTALFVTVMSAQAAQLMSAGEPENSATAAGIRAAFMIGAIISVLAIPAAFLIRKPADSVPETTSLSH